MPQHSVYGVHTCLSHVGPVCLTRVAPLRLSLPIAPHGCESASRETCVCRPEPSRIELIEGNIIMIIIIIIVIIISEE